ncbi:MAG: hypothetical protein GY851_01890, partial [bacterium]|nr:hypothetical protein [bacterium]
YLLCDTENRCALSPLTEETGATAPSIRPDGQWLYYFVNETTVGGGQFTLKRVRLDGTQRETILVVDGPIPGTSYRPSRLYPLSTISSDGKRLGLSAFMGDGNTENAPYGLMVFDVDEASVRVVLEGPSWLNMHPQYCRATDPEGTRDVLVQENHGGVFDERGKVSRLTGGDGADIHVIRDDGTNFRAMPWGRDGTEFCQGHQCWRGDTRRAITSTSVRGRGVCELVESPPTASDDHDGLATPGGERIMLTEGVEHPMFCHFATDSAGKRFISDYRVGSETWELYVAEFPEDAPGPLINWHRVLDSRTDPSLKGCHIHPFLSPDGTRGFFNSTDTGKLQAYMVTGLFEA